MGRIEDHQNAVEGYIKGIASNEEFKQISKKWMNESAKLKYSYNFSWMGRPIIQYPGDIVVMQEIIWQTRPDVIIETGIAHGGGLLFYASILELMGKGRVIGVEKLLHKENRDEIEKSFLMKRISIIDGDSASEDTLNQIKSTLKKEDRVLVCLDSNHTHEHVLNELRAYSPLVCKDSYIVVFDTSINEAEDSLNADRPWSTERNPLTAVREFLTETDRFQIDTKPYDKLQLSVCPSGFLKCVK